MARERAESGTPPTDRQLLENLVRQVRSLSRKVGQIDKVVGIILDGQSSNQTNPEWLRRVKPADLGTGLFLIPDVANPDPDEVMKVLVPDLTYRNCVQRGRRVRAFKWVPHSRMSYEELSLESCGVTPTPQES